MCERKGPCAESLCVGPRVWYPVLPSAYVATRLFHHSAPRTGRGSSSPDIPVIELDDSKRTKGHSNNEVRPVNLGWVGRFGGIRDDVSRKRAERKEVRVLTIRLSPVRKGVNARGRGPDAESVWESVSLA